MVTAVAGILMLPTTAIRKCDVAARVLGVVGGGWWVLALVVVMTRETAELREEKRKEIRLD